MKLYQISYSELSELLLSKDVTINEATLKNRISRGSFSADFFIQVMDALGAPVEVKTHFQQNLTIH